MGCALPIELFRAREESLGHPSSGSRVARGAADRPQPLPDRVASRSRSESPKRGLELCLRCEPGKLCPDYCLRRSRKKLADLLRSLDQTGYGVLAKGRSPRPTAHGGRRIRNCRGDEVAGTGEVAVVSNADRGRADQPPSRSDEEHVRGLSPRIARRVNPDVLTETGATIEARRRTRQSNATTWHRYLATLATHMEEISNGKARSGRVSGARKPRAT